MTGGHPCPSCGADTTVKDSRPNEHYDGSIRRRRHCPACGDRFTTYEVTTDFLDNTEGCRVTQRAVFRLQSLIDDLTRQP